MARQGKKKIYSYLNVDKDDNYEINAIYVQTYFNLFHVKHSISMKV